MAKILIIAVLVSLFSCSQGSNQPENCSEALKNYLQKANDVCKGDTSEVHLLYDKLSADAQLKMDAVQGYLVYILAKTTRKGTIEKIEVLETNQEIQDLQATIRHHKRKAICTVRLTFLDKSQTTFEQRLVNEKGEWKVEMQ